MSFSLSIQAMDDTEYHEKVDAWVASIPGGPQDGERVTKLLHDLSHAVGQQVEALKNAGQVPEPSTFNISISGHTTDGGLGSSVSVSVAPVLLAVDPTQPASTPMQADSSPAIEEPDVAGQDIGREAHSHHERGTMHGDPPSQTI